MDIIMTMTPATSLRAALREGAQAYGFDLTGSTSAFGASRPGSLVAHNAGSQPFFAARAERIGKRRPHPSRFSSLSCVQQVS